MALFKIFKGLATNLNNQAKKEGYAWLTTDDQKLYVDISDTERVALNAEKADVLKDTTGDLSANDIKTRLSEIESAAWTPPAEGESGQVLTKTDEGEEWAEVESYDILDLSNGEEGQVLVKTTDGAEWKTVSASITDSVSGEAGQVLVKQEDGSVAFATFTSGPSIAVSGSTLVITT